MHIAGVSLNDSPQCSRVTESGILGLEDEVGYLLIRIFVVEEFTCTVLWYVSLLQGMIMNRQPLLRSDLGPMFQRSCAFRFIAAGNQQDRLSVCIAKITQNFLKLVTVSRPDPPFPIDACLIEDGNRWCRLLSHKQIVCRGACLTAIHIHIPCVDTLMV